MLSLVLSLRWNSLMPPVAWRVKAPTCTGVDLFAEVCGLAVADLLTYTPQSVWTVMFTEAETI